MLLCSCKRECTYSSYMDPKSWNMHDNNELATGLFIQFSSMSASSCSTQSCASDRRSFWLAEKGYSYILSSFTATCNICWDTVTISGATRCDITDCKLNTRKYPSVSTENHKLLSAEKSWVSLSMNSPKVSTNRKVTEIPDVTLCKCSITAVFKYLHTHSTLFHSGLCC